MNREILFRGKVKYNGQHLFSGDWVYGSLIVKIIGVFIYVIEEDELGNTTRGFGVEIIPETVGQFTGLNDKNGKEIYEGDRVKCLVGHTKRRNDLYTIIYRLGSPSMDNGTTETPVSFPTLQDQLWSYLDYDTKISLCLEITGNIHDND